MKSRASFYAWMFFVVACGTLLSVSIQQTCFAHMAQQLSRRVRVMLLGSILNQEVAFFDEDKNTSGRLTSALATDATYIRGAVGDAMGIALQNVATLVAGYVIALIYDWRMALLVTGERTCTQHLHGHTMIHVRVGAAPCRNAWGHTIYVCLMVGACSRMCGR